MANTGLTIGHIAQTALSRRRRDTVIRVSEAGGSKADAMAETGLTANGLSTLLRREFGSQKWPIAEELLK